MECLVVAPTPTRCAGFFPDNSDGMHGGFVRIIEGITGCCMWLCAPLFTATTGQPGRGLQYSTSGAPTLWSCEFPEIDTFMFFTGKLLSFLSHSLVALSDYVASLARLFALIHAGKHEAQRHTSSEDGVASRLPCECLGAGLRNVLNMCCV